MCQVFRTLNSSIHSYFGSSPFTFVLLLPPCLQSVWSFVFWRIMLFLAHHVRNDWSENQHTSWLWKSCPSKSHKIIVVGNLRVIVVVVEFELFLFIMICHHIQHILYIFKNFNLTGRNYHMNCTSLNMSYLPLHGFMIYYSTWISMHIHMLLTCVVGQE